MTPNMTPQSVSKAVSSDAEIARGKALAARVIGLAEADRAFVLTLLCYDATEAVEAALARMDEVDARKGRMTPALRQREGLAP